MRRRLLPFALLLGLLALPAAAEEAPVEEGGAVRLRYGVAQHQALFLAGGERRPAQGFSADDFALSGLLFFGEGPLGAAFGLGRELVTFRASDGTGGDVLQAVARTRLGLAGRVRVGPALVGATLGYELGQLPLGSGPEGVPSPGLRHAVVLAPRVQVQLPWELRLEVSGELPLTLWAADAARRPVESYGSGLGVALGRRLGRVDRLSYGLWLDYHAAFSDSARGVGDATYLRTSRVGLTAELTWDAPSSSDS